MRNKKIKIAIVSLILLVVIGVNISYADVMPNLEVENETSFFEVNKLEISQGETLEMTIDLSKIDYNSFKFTLNSNVEIADDIYSDEENDIDVSGESNDIVIDIDKEEMNLDKIVLYYQIPDSLEIGTKMKLTANVVEVQSDEIVEETEENEELSEVEKAPNTLLKEIEITIVEKTFVDNENKDQNENNNGGVSSNENTTKPNNNQNDTNKNESSVAQTEENKNFEGSVDKENQLSNMSSQMSTEKNMQSASVQIGETTVSSMQNIGSSNETQVSNTKVATAVYNGSNNNYLSSLEIEGVSLTSSFSKEKQTYFVTVEDLETLIVSAVAEDDSSKVTITGTDLKDGENKVLISVTAENGDVRYYRIFVTKN